MFKQIVANLSLSPAAGSQLNFYIRRLRKEKLTRQLSVAMAITLVFIQGAVVVAPPNAATAASSNDIIYGGLDHSHPKADLLDIYDANRDSRNTGFHALFGHFGITRADLAKTTKGTINSSNHQLKSVGHNPHSSKDKKFVAGGHTYYLRPLYTWGDHLSYPALVGKRAVDGKFFAVMINCGNIAIIDTTPEEKEVTFTPKPKPKTKETITQKPTPPPPPPAPKPQPKPQVPPKVVTPPPTPQPSGTPNIALSKTASIIHPDGTSTDATAGPAVAGDVIEYTLTTVNSGSAAAKDYVVTEDVNDIMEYADLLDARGGIFNQAEGTITWPKETIAAGSNYIASFQVKVKSPIPAQPASVSDPESFDLKLDNVYGNSVRINLEVPPEKQVEVASQTLPQTGAGTNALIVFGLLGAILYFYFRNRQLITEIAILRGDHHGENR